MSDRTVPRLRRLPAVVAAVLLAAAAHLAFDALTHAASWTNNDNALILFIAREMARGARLYVDWLDPALPSIFFIGRMAVGVSRLGLPVVLSYNLIVLLVGFVGSIVLLRALAARGESRAVVVLTVAAYVFFLMKPGALTRDFGQREHLFALLLVPELFALLSGDRPRWRPLWCGALAFTATIKPHFVVMVALLEATAPGAGRGSRGDLVGFAAGAIAPFVLLWGHSTASFHGLFSETIDLHLSGAYALLNASPRTLLARGPLSTFALGIAAIVLAMRSARRSVSRRATAWRASLLIVLAAVAVLQQQKYFPYHFIPLFGLAVVSGAWAVGGLLEAYPRAVSDGLALAAVLFGAALFHLDVARNVAPLPIRLAQVVGAQAPTMAVASIYSHGLCTPFAGAPRCLGPEAQAPRLPFAARQPDGEARVRRWASAFGDIVRRGRPELVVLSTSSAARMPGGRTPAAILLRDFPSIGSDYVRVTPAVEQHVDARNWLVFRRRDVPEIVGTRARGAGR